MPPESSALDLTEALSAPLGDVIAAVGRGVAEAQTALDAATVEGFKRMFSGGDAMLEEMRRIGYHPTWYRIPEVEAEVTISLSISGESRQAGTTPPAGPDAAIGGPGRIQLYAAPVDASYANKYDFQVQAASKLRFKVVAVPPSPEATEMKVVPGLGNKTFEEAKALLDELRIPYRLEDPKLLPAPAAPIRSFSPRVGTVLARGQAVILNV